LTQDATWIFGGTVTKPGTYPSAALLGREELVDKINPINPNIVTKVPKMMFICGGVLINRLAMFITCPVFMFKKLSSFKLYSPPLLRQGYMLVSKDCILSDRENKQCSGTK
jgi:hypothetical protein